jgi:hypothetical protein
LREPFAHIFATESNVFETRVFDRFLGEINRFRVAFNADNALEFRRSGKVKDLRRNKSSAVAPETFIVAALANCSIKYGLP